MHLGETCRIRSGLTLRERLSVQRYGGTLAVQQGDLSPRGEFDREHAVRIAAPSSSLHRVGPGELVFRSRGPHWSAWTPHGLDEPVVAIAPLFILTPTPDIDPRYVAWLISRPPAQSYFAAEAMGTGVKMISKSVLAGLPVEFPPLPVQHAIVESAALGEHERMLATRLNDLQHGLLSARLDRIARLAAGSSDPDRITR